MDLLYELMIYKQTKTEKNPQTQIIFIYNKLINHGLQL